jgi:hypothetical protein
MGQRPRRSRTSPDSVARQQSTFREVNERIEELSERLGPTEQPLSIVCECGRVECHELLELTPAEYEALRRSPVRFAVADGHQIPRVERVVARNERFLTVEKFGRGGRTAARLDPRRPDSPDR